MELSFFNPFSDKFLQVQPDGAEIRDIEAHLNSYSRGEDSIDYMRLVNGYNTRYASPDQPYDQANVMFETIFANKRQRINYYRSMAMYPFIKKCLTIIADECCCENSLGEYATFGIDTAYKGKIKVSEFNSLQQEFKYLINCVIKKDELWYLFYKWLIDGELFLEICLNDKKNKVSGVKVLPPYCTMCIYDEGIITGYIEDTNLIAMDNRSGEVKKFTKNQIAYSNYGFWGNNRNDVRGHLEAAIRHLNQLRAIEDSLTVYRITRAPEKRIWNIYTGKMPATKVPEYMQEIRSKYRKQLSIDPKTGAIISNQNVQAMTEDIWLAKDGDGQGSTVESFKGSTEFSGQLDDVKMFKHQVADALQIPDSRWNFADGGAGQYTQGVEGLTIDEAAFQKVCRRFRHRFADILKQIFIVQLQIRGYKAKYLDSAIYNIDLVPATDFEKMRELALAEKRAGVIGSISQFLPTSANSKDNAEELHPILSKQYMMEYWLGMSTEEMLKNNSMLEKEIQDLKNEASAAAEEGGDDEDDGDDLDF